VVGDGNGVWGVGGKSLTGNRYLKQNSCNDKRVTKTVRGKIKIREEGTGAREHMEEENKNKGVGGGKPRQREGRRTQVERKSRSKGMGKSVLATRRTKS